MREVRKASCTSQYRGVTYDRTRGTWLVQIAVDRVVHSIGRFEDEIDAACAFDAAALRLLDAEEAQFRMNFPDENRRPQIRKHILAVDLSQRQKRRNTSSQYWGVIPEGNRWLAYVDAPDRSRPGRRSVRKRVCTHATEKEAALARDRAMLHFYGKDNLPLPLNFPNEARKLGAASPLEIRAERRRESTAAVAPRGSIHR